MNRITNVLLKSFITNICLSFIKIIFGFIGKSGALIADGMHSFSDTLTDIFAIVGDKLAQKPADKEHPFGHGKIEYITCIVIGFAILSVGISIIYSAVFGEVSIPSLFVVVVSLIVIIFKIILSRYLLKKGYEYDSNILKASGKESYTDVISSVVVLLSVLLSQLGKYLSLFSYADKVAMVIVGLLILRAAYNVLKENFSMLLGEQVTDEEYINDLRKIILSFDSVIDIDSLIVLKYGVNYQITSEVVMDKNIVLKDAHDVLELIEDKLKEYDLKIKYITIHVNPN